MVGEGTNVTRHVVLAVLGSFRLLLAGHAARVSIGSERLLAFVALHPQPVARPFVAGTLWSEVSERRAFATLRSSLARLDPISRRALKVDPFALQLAEDVVVDFRDAQTLAYRLLDPDVTPSGADLSPAAIVSLSHDLLPGWYDDWVVLRAEDWRQLRLHALEALAGRLTEERRFGQAALAAGAAISADPLRESAHSALIRVHLAEGNQYEALHQFERFSRLLQTELGLKPTPRLRKLVETIS